MRLPRSWQERIGIGSAATAYLAATVFDVVSNGGWDSVPFYGTVGFLVTFPVLILAGKLLTALVDRIRWLDPAPRAAALVAPTLLVAGLLTWEACLQRDPMRRFDRQVASPPPPGVRILSSYQYSGFNFHIAAFHFTLAPVELSKLLGDRPFRHKFEPGGFRLDQVREDGSRRPGYPVPPPEFRAVHRYQWLQPNGRHGRTLTLYGDAAQAEFFAYLYAG